MCNKERLEEEEEGWRRAVTVRVRPIALAGCEANQRYAGLTRVRLIYSRAAAPSQGRVTTVQRCGALLQAVGIRVRRLTFVSASGRQHLAEGPPRPPERHQVELIELVKQACFHRLGLFLKLYSIHSPVDFRVNQHAPNL